jgi:Pao retrotransposon peptidase
MLDDQLTFSVAAPQAVPGTRREILSCVASIFDPLGLASPLTVRAKIGMKCLAEVGLR